MVLELNPGRIMSAREESQAMLFCLQAPSPTPIHDVLRQTKDVLETRNGDDAQ